MMKPDWKRYTTRARDVPAEVSAVAHAGRVYVPRTLLDATTPLPRVAL